MFNLQSLFQKPMFKVFNLISSGTEIVDLQLPAYEKQDTIHFDSAGTNASLGFDDYLSYLHMMIRWFQAHNLENKVIATFSQNRIEWDITAMATFYTTNTLFPLDTKMDETELLQLLSINLPDYILVSPAQLNRVEEILHHLNLPTTILVTDLMSVFEDINCGNFKHQKNEISISQIVEQDDPHRATSASEKLKDKNSTLGLYTTSRATIYQKLCRLITVIFSQKLKKHLMR